MVFKVKERGKKDYSFYKRRQIERSVRSHILGPEENPKVFQFPGLQTHAQGPRFSEIFGYNWPYDDFSLIETVKIDVGIEVQK